METEKSRNPYAKYHIDDDVALLGVVYQDEDVRIRVTYAGDENTRYGKMLKLKLKPFETRIRNDNFPDKEFYKILAEVYAATVILGWDSKAGEDENGETIWENGVYDAEGNILPFTEKNVIAGLNLGTRLFQDVIKVATNFNLFRQNQMEETGKN
jgi:hypothetical protein